MSEKWGFPNFCESQRHRGMDACDEGDRQSRPTPQWPLSHVESENLRKMVGPQGTPFSEGRGLGWNPTRQSLHWPGEEEGRLSAGQPHWVTERT